MNFQSKRSAVRSCAALTLVFAAAWGPTHVEAQYRWEEKLPAAPGLPPIGYTTEGMVFDTARNVIVLFEFDSSTNSTRTVEWDGAVWREGEFGTGPSRRDGFRMVYDPIRSETVLFGGGHMFTEYGDTWTWDGISWTQVSNTGPSPRYAHSMAWDPRHGGILLRGGITGTHEQDTWLWNGTTWTRLSTNGPAVTDAPMVFDPARQQMILFGGSDSSEISGETWNWNGISWVQLPVTGPTRMYHEMVYFEGKIFLFGGVGISGLLDDTWTWDGTSWTELNVSGPSPRFNNGMAVDTNRNRVVLFGGHQSQFSSPMLDDTWEWDGSEWKPGAWIPGNQTRFAGMVYDSVVGATLLFGGSGRDNTNSGSFSNILSLWDGTRWTRFATPTDAPTGRRRFGIAFRPVSFFPYGYTAIQGGELVGSSLYDTSLWNTLTWININTPLSGFPGNVMVYDSWQDRYVMYNGATFVGPGNSWTNVGTPNPPIRQDAAMAFDSTRGVTVLFGGANGSTVYGDTWEFSGTWELRSSTGPSPRKYHAMTYDEASGFVVLFGGESASGPESDTWVWDGTSWQELDIAGPSPRSGHSMSYDSGRDRIVLFGGLTTAHIGNTWELVWDCPCGLKNRFLTARSLGVTEPTAIRVTLLSVHHPDPSNGAPDLSMFEGQVRWAGPTFVESESTSNTSPVYASRLQCSPHYQLRNGANLWQITGSAVVPSSQYRLDWLAQSCMGQEQGCTDILKTETLDTARWGDVLAPFSISGGTVQPDFADISGLVDKFKGVPQAPAKAQSLLAGTDEFGNVDVANDLDFTHISVCVDAFRGRPYPYTIQTCP